MAKIEQVYPERWKKLPVWAQDEMRQLYTEQEHWHGEYLKLIANEQTAVVQDPYSDNPRYLDPRRDVRFVLGDEPYTREWIDVRLRQREGTWYVDVLAGDMLLLTPTGGNTIRMRVEK